MASFAVSFFMGKESEYGIMENKVYICEMFN